MSAEAIFCLGGIGIVVTLLVINYIAVTIQERREGDTIPFDPETDIDWEALSDPQLQEFLAQGNKIGAIKVYRQLTGMGLKESKDAIDYAAKHPDEWGEKKKKSAYDSQDAGVRDLIQDGRIDEAVEVYQRFAGVDEYTSRDAVTELERQIRQSGG